MGVEEETEGKERITYAMCPRHLKLYDSALYLTLKCYDEHFDALGFAQTSFRLRAFRCRRCCEGTETIRIVTRRIPAKNRVTRGARVAKGQQDIISIIIIIIINHNQLVNRLFVCDKSTAEWTVYE